jgi:hypothetical protein
MIAPTVEEAGLLQTKSEKPLEQRIANMGVIDDEKR